MSFASHRPCKPHRLVFSKSLLGWLTLLLGCSLCLGSPRAWAQDATGKKGTEKKDAENTDSDKKTEKEDEKDEPEPPEPEDLKLTTEDGLELRGKVFPNAKANEETIPVILLHGFKGSGKDFTQGDGLAAFLQKQKKFRCTVIVPDLRGHGESTQIKVGKKFEKVDPKKLKPSDVGLMLTQDLGAVKDYLWEQNNKRKLNIDKTVVIGVEEGAALALSYAAWDAQGYEQQQAKVGPLKLGLFVKGVVLISPKTNVIGLNTMKIVKMPVQAPICSFLPVMIVAGNQKPANPYLKDAEQIRTIFVIARPPAVNAKPQSMTVWSFKIGTQLQGTKLLAEPSLKVPEKIALFMKARLVTNDDAKDWGWKPRKLPHE
jgi:pimeloyl-ACP methyl ester carboxylesterase